MDKKDDMKIVPNNCDKLINCKCVCGQGLNWIEKEIIVLEPCEHILHKSCYLLFDICPICKEKCDKIYTEKELGQLMKNDIKYYQKYVDVHSMKNINYICDKDTLNFVYGLPNILDIIGRLPFSRGHSDGLKLCKDVLTIAGTNMVVRGRENIKDCNKVIILNHTSYLDFIVAFYVFRSGFLATSSINDVWIGRKLTEILPILLIDRGQKSNTVERMKEYVEKYGSICLFPEGIMTHPDTIIRFRSGAFNTGHPILPAVITFDPVVADVDIFEFIQKMASAEKVNVTINILPMEYPPFTEKKIEKIRRNMAKVGNMALSRVSNRDIREIPSNHV